ncbi:MAG TPA: alpha/beta hydrolase, partial [Psychrobacter sp.]|nr:alpha/beta hydrolase [Psychrobacter sp.]
HMPTITIPIYAISAKGDQFISPTLGCRALFNDFNNHTNTFREYSLSHGDLDDYSHSRILNSRPAAKEVWPTVAAWIEKHAT